MPRIKQTAQKGKHAASSFHQPEIEEDDQILDQFVEEEEMMDNPIQLGGTIGVRRKRTLEQIRQDRQKKWEESMKKRIAKNERHVDVASIEANHQAIGAIEAQGLSYYFGENPGYSRALVVEFYKNMKIPEVVTDHEPVAVISSRIGRVEVLVNRYEIRCCFY
ncbi:hypothetical protein RHSIM_Rhsim11G0012200 [Rhododendron simsii]|uniref:Uncharacterized protein n=1 Tax=Rhododendron simsii TaxID=118357 RepID=A0A834L8B3_RHOSS|nr:hypothetical protein RHSIM_Rhsim11G0012200 [Rhododendron simsii]